MGFWQLWIDTGGTFTDCVARHPSGGLRRAKVLSTSALRGTMDRVTGSASFRTRLAAGLTPGVVSGLDFTPLEARGDGGALVVERHEGDVLVLSGSLPDGLGAGSAFELRSAEEAPILAARLVTGTPLGRPLPPCEMRLATTLGTNALLEGRGAAVAVFLTRGFGDLLAIGTQQRPELFALAVRKPAPLHAASVEVPERVASDGSIVQSLDPGVLQEELERLIRAGIDEAAVALINAHANPLHERRLADRLLELGFRHVSRSSEMSASLGILARARTAVVDARLSPVLGDYLTRISAPLAAGDEERGRVIGTDGDDQDGGKTGADDVHDQDGGRRLLVMTSAGGLVDAASFRPKDGLLSGPAGGVVGAAFAARRSGYRRVISFDMGGTSTDVARFDGDFEYEFEHAVAGVELAAPALAVESVAAGGGSVCEIDGDRLRVGPRSAGAMPGPACYGTEGPLTLTDVNLLLGRLDPVSFGVPLAPDRAAARAEEARAALAARTGGRVTTEQLLEGFLEIANERMADAIRAVSERRGYDPAEHALIAFGGAGGQHACGVAQRLGIRTVLVPADASLLSALGLGQAVLERFAERQVLAPLERVEPRLPGLVAELAAEAEARVRAEAEPDSRVAVRRRIVALRFAGQESVLQVELDAPTPLRAAFAARYAAVFGHAPEDRPVEVESVRVVASVDRDAGASDTMRPVEGPDAGEPAEPASFTEAWSGGRRARIPVFERAGLAPGAAFAGPALVREPTTAIVVEAGWRARVDRAGALVLTRASGERRARRPAAVRRELLVNRLSSIAREMGERLRRMALSTNVKERLDFSCALLDAEGGLVVSAPHVPVHLGALGVCVRRVREALPLGPGDVAVTNHPAFGGSHLPDVTVVTPIHAADGRLLGYAANRAHHAEIGGTRPGSMPPFAASLAEEGVAIPPLHLARGGRADWEALRRLLSEAPHPSRAVEDNLADLRSAVAANHHGAGAVGALAAEAGPNEVASAMEALQERAARLVRERLARMQPGRRVALERMDDGSPLRVAIDIQGEGMTIDFTGSAGRHPGNLNATPAIVGSVVMYVIRLLVDQPLPLNDGLLRPIRLVLPAGILNPDFPDDPALAPAVAGGNVETSQRLADLLLKALGLAGCSQGTMNNVLFGTGTFGYYETVCGGCGAGPGFEGASAVHSHMTNTRATDPEVLERRYPVRLERFEVRRGSGGAGRYRGGDGAVREITFLEPMSLSILSQHRVERPYGLEGGGPALPGAQRVVRASGAVVELGPVDGCEVEAGDRLVLETPGGGGYGAAEPTAQSLSSIQAASR
ncbi:MAG TPA: hydantoinase B/oxoprolinase family protein [Gemmatimonadota bacterium]